MTVITCPKCGAIIDDDIDDEYGPMQLPADQLDEADSQHLACGSCDWPGSLGREEED